MEIQLHADRRLEALVHGARLPWVPSPEPGVERRMLERSGGEVALASTIVRYAPGRSFPAHVHQLGEEFFVLKGTFSDEHGDYPTGTYVRNPPGSSHAPSCREGCVIFVKLRQMLADEPETVRTPLHALGWNAAEDGCKRASLYANGRISVALEMAGPHSGISGGDGEGGLEIFVLSGSLGFLDRPAWLHSWSWLRTPGPISGMRAGSGGALLWVKRGHLR